MKRKLRAFLRFLFYGLILFSAGFVSCLTSMGLAIRGAEIVVPDLVGRTVGEGRHLVGQRELGLKVESYRFDDQVQVDRILSQHPTPGSKLKKNRNVRVIVSLGPRHIPVPDLLGTSLRASQILLLRRGLSMGMTSTIRCQDTEPGQVLSQDPRPDVKLAQSPQVNILLSAGSERPAYVMPDLTGLVLQDVLPALEGLGLKVVEPGYRTVPGLAKDTILNQTPLPGNKIGQGDSVRVDVSR
ncbi:MAG: PASTA domain-containing protein [Acidobacteriota bacterium]